VRLRAGDLEGAASDCETGLRLVDAPHDDDDDVPAVDRARTALLLANNRSRVAKAAGDADGLTRWRGIVAARLADVPIEERPGPQWLSPPEDLSALGAARDFHAAVLEAARAALDPETEAVSAHQLALVAYRLGDTETARDGFARALAIWRVIGGFAEDIATEELNLAVTAFRARDWDTAESGFQALRQSPLFAAAEAQAESLAALAMIAAGRGDRSLANERAAAAVTLAHDSGDAGVQVRVLRSVGEAHLLLHDHAAARLELANALQLADESGAAAPEDLLGVLAALHAAGGTDGADGAILERAAALLPDALADANAWWDLPRLVPALAQARGSDGAVAAALALARQRLDCRRNGD
jgi:tetratricopeptide (TPR) repeat protein